MKHYIVFNVTKCYYAIVSIEEEVDPNDIGLHTDWIIHGPHDTFYAAEIGFNQLVASQKDFK